MLILLYGCNNSGKRDTLIIQDKPQDTISGNDLLVDSMIKEKDSGKKVIINDTTFKKMDTAAKMDRIDRMDKEKKQYIKKIKPKLTENPASVHSKIDSSIFLPPFPFIPNKKKSGVLGYSYFKQMRQEETRNIDVQVVAVNAGNMVSKVANNILADLKEMNNQVKAERKADTASYFTTDNIYFYKYLTITLSDPNDNFKIDSLHFPSRQFIDTIETNKWQWAVTPKTSVKNARLFINVVAEREDGSQKPIGIREIAIEIELKTNFWRTLLTWLSNNPDKLLVLILIPLAGYFGKKIIDTIKLKKNNTEGKTKV